MNKPLILTNFLRRRNNRPRVYRKSPGAPFARTIATVRVGRGPQNLAFNPRTNRLYVTNGSSNSVSVINTLTNQVVATVPVGKAPGAMIVNSATNLIYVSNVNDSTVSVINGISNRVVLTLRITGPVGLVLNPAANHYHRPRGSG